MSYFTPTGPCQATLVIKKSEFIGFGVAINSRDELMAQLAHLKQQYPDARHICYGYILGNPMNTTSAGFDDDGEPSGTAGKPILNVLQHKKIGNCAIFVVRYFGGIKLGAGGLTRAYSGTAQAVVDNMTLGQFVPKTTLSITTQFANEAYVRHIASSLGARIDKVDYTQQVVIALQPDEANVAPLIEKIGIHGQVVLMDI